MNALKISLHFKFNYKEKYIKCINISIDGNSLLTKKCANMNFEILF